MPVTLGALSILFLPLVRSNLLWSHLEHSSFSCTGSWVTSAAMVGYLGGVQRLQRARVHHGPIAYRASVTVRMCGSVPIFIPRYMLYEQARARNHSLDQSFCFRLSSRPCDTFTAPSPCGFRCVDRARPARELACGAAR